MMKKKHCNGYEFNFLVGKSIVKVEKKKVPPCPDTYILTCKDGTIIEIDENEGCGGCGNGWSSFNDLKKLEKNDNVITNIETEYKYEKKFTEICDDYRFKMYVYYADNTINTLNGDDGYGNGYYGGGFYVTIKKAKEVK